MFKKGIFTTRYGNMTGLEFFGKMSVDGCVENYASKQGITFADSENNKVFATIHKTVLGMYAVINTKTDAYDIASVQILRVHSGLLSFKSDSNSFCLGYIIKHIFTYALGLGYIHARHNFIGPFGPGFGPGGIMAFFHKFLKGQIDVFIIGCVDSLYFRLGDIIHIGLPERNQIISKILVSSSYDLSQHEINGACSIGKILYTAINLFRNRPTFPGMEFSRQNTHTPLGKMLTLRKVKYLVYIILRKRSALAQNIKDEFPYYLVLVLFHFSWYITPCKVNILRSNLGYRGYNI